MAVAADKLKYVVDADSTIEEAWGQIEVNKHRSVIVAEEGKVVGTLSDGDLRKAMLARRLLSTPVREVMNVNFTSLTEKEKKKSKSMFEKKNIFIIPVVDEEMKLLDILVR